MSYSKNDLRLAKVALLENRMGAELSALVRKHGGVPVCVGAVSERPVDASADVSKFIDALTEGRTYAVVLQTGVSVNELARVAESLGRGTELIVGLARVTKVCRGPKPVAALKRLGLSADVAVPEPHTTAEMVLTLSAAPLAGRTVTIVHHGERNPALVEAATRWCGAVEELFLYRWQLPEDTAPLRRLVHDLVDGSYDAVAFTSQAQVRHLFIIARQEGLEADLKQVLNGEVVTAAVGPTCAAELVAHGVVPDVAPEHPKMGHMVLALAEFMSASTSNRAGALV
jgi:uroporphyrinogen-III synthase